MTKKAMAIPEIMDSPEALKAKLAAMRAAQKTFATYTDVYKRQEPYLIAFPGIAIVLAVMAFNLIGDGLWDALDPKLRN